MGLIHRLIPRAGFAAQEWETMDVILANVAMNHLGR